MRRKQVVVGAGDHEDGNAGAVEVLVRDRVAGQGGADCGHRGGVEGVQLLVQEGAGGVAFHEGGEGRVRAEALCGAEVRGRRGRPRAEVLEERGRPEPADGVGQGERLRRGWATVKAVTHQPPIDWPTRCAPGVPVASRTAAMSATAAALPCTPEVNVELPKPRQSHVITRKPLAASVGTCWNHAACVPPAPWVSMMAGRSSSPLTS